MRFSPDCEATIKAAKSLQVRRVGALNGQPRKFDALVVMRHHVADVAPILVRTCADLEVAIQKTPAPHPRRTTRPIRQRPPPPNMRAKRTAVVDGARPIGQRSQANSG